MKTSPGDAALWTAWILPGTPPALLDWDCLLPVWDSSSVLDWLASTAPLQGRQAGAWFNSLAQDHCGFNWGLQGLLVLH